MFKTYSIILTLATLALLASCAQSPKGSDATVTDAKDAVKATAEATAYQLAANSHVTWIGSAPTKSHNGTIGITDGHIEVEGEKITGSFDIDMNAIDVLDLTDETGKGKLIGHLKNDDFFDVANHPTAKFEITGVAPYSPAAGEDQTVAGINHKISGNLTLRGTTKGIEFPAKVEITEGKVNAEAQFVIDRTLWNVSYNSEASITEQLKDKVIHDKVSVGFKLEFAAKAATATM